MIPQWIEGFLELDHNGPHNGELDHPLDPMDSSGSVECKLKRLFTAILTIKLLNYMQFPIK